MVPLFFDIETIPAQSDEDRAAYLASLKPPRNYGEEAAQKWRESQDVDATALDPMWGHICAISWAEGDAEPFTRVITTVDDEMAILANFLEAIPCDATRMLVGHNITGFDIPFVIKRAVILGLKLPPDAELPRDAKPWSKTVFDTMTRWDARKFASLDAMCRVFRIPGKGDFSGADVAGAFADGDLQRIADYCADDVRRVRSVYQRMMESGW